VRVGLLEDNPAIQDCITVALEMQGHVVSVHGDGFQFLEALTSPSPGHDLLAYDVVIVDLGLPGDVKGDEVLEFLCNDPVYRTLPIIVHSGASSSVLYQLSTRFPSVVVVQKPVPMRTLLQYVEEVGTRRIQSTA